MTKNTLNLLFKIALMFLLIFGSVGLAVYIQFPSDKQIRGCIKTKMFDVQLCPGSADYIRLSDISANMQKAVVLTEDAGFWNHNGFDLQELEKSLKTNVHQGKYVRGGSTITQQLSKNLFLSKEKTLSRKFMEAIITIRIEKVLSKKEILERYLNVVQFGKDIFGIKKASQHYFSKLPSQLSLVESAFLTFLLPSPEKYSKSFYKRQLTPFAQNRVTQIIENLYQYNKITDDQYLAARNELDRFLNNAQPQESEIQGQENYNEEDIVPEE